MTYSTITIQIASEFNIRWLRFDSLNKAREFCALHFKPSPERIFGAAVVQPLNVDGDIYLSVFEGDASLDDLLPTLQPFDAVAYCGTANPDQIAHVRASFMEYLERLQTPQGRAELKALRAKHAAPAPAVGYDGVPF